MKLSPNAKNYIRMYRQNKQGVKRANIIIADSATIGLDAMEQMIRANKRTDNAYQRKDKDLAKKYRAFHLAQHDILVHKSNKAAEYWKKKKLEYDRGMKIYKTKVINTKEYKSGEWRPKL